MIALLVSVATILGALLGAALALAFRREPEPPPDPTPPVLAERMRRQFVLTLVDGGAFRGVLVAADDESMVLGDVEHLADPTSPPMSVDGELVVAMAKVKYAQRL